MAFDELLLGALKISVFFLIVLAFSHLQQLCKDIVYVYHQINVRMWEAVTFLQMLYFNSLKE